jgi:hypothetical protein
MLDAVDKHLQVMPQNRYSATARGSLIVHALDGWRPLRALPRPQVQFFITADWTSAGGVVRALGQLRTFRSLGAATRSLATRSHAAETSYVQWPRFSSHAFHFTVVSGPQEGLVTKITKVTGAAKNALKQKNMTCGQHDEARPPHRHTRASPAAPQLRSARLVRDSLLLQKLRHCDAPSLRQHGSLCQHCDAPSLRASFVMRARAGSCKRADRLGPGGAAG